MSFTYRTTTHLRPLSRTPSAARMSCSAPKLGDVRPHDCRHTYGSLLLDTVVPLPTVSQLLAHANVQTTARIYAGVLKGRSSAPASWSPAHVLTTRLPRRKSEDPTRTETAEMQGLS